MIINRVPLRVVAFLAFLGVTATAAASPVTLAFSGTLTNTVGSLTTGQAYSGSYTYDPSIAPVSGANSAAAVFDNLLSVSITIGSFTATIGPGTGLPEIQQENDFDVGGGNLHDIYALAGRNPVGSSPIDGLNITEIGFRLDDSAHTAISDASTLVMPSLANFDQATMLLFFGTPGNQGFEILGGTLTNLSIPSVPEPGTLLLVAIALGALVWRGSGVLRTPIR